MPSLRSTLANKPFDLPMEFPEILDKYKIINRVIIIGNGFDLAHGLKSSISEFIYNYSHQIYSSFLSESHYTDQLISITSQVRLFSTRNQSNSKTPKEAFDWLKSQPDQHYIKVTWKSDFFRKIIFILKDKNWVDIELLYFDILKSKTVLQNESAIKKLNDDLDFLKNKFIDYLKHELNKTNYTINKDLLFQFMQPVKPEDTRPNTLIESKDPNKVCVLNFNYTHIANLYSNHFKNKDFNYIPIHGSLEETKYTSQEPIFGFGDEIDEEYRKFELLGTDEVFKHIKSFKYLQFNHYRNLIEFIESDPFQVYIFGHSCGLSDRTLLNTIFEHENCISIKPFYYKNESGDDYEQKSFAIARHFSSKSELRAKVVNKQYCEPMVQPVKQTSE